MAGLKIALEAEQGFDKSKQASALKDADGRLRDGLADCAIAICYPDGLIVAEDLIGCELLHSLRTYKDRPPASQTVWTSGNIAQLAGVIRRLPDQLGDPDNIAHFLSGSLDRAVARLSESQKIDLAENLDLPSGRPLKIEYGNARTSRYNQAAKRAMLVIATAVMFHSQLDKRRREITPLWDHRYSPPRSYEGDWPPVTASHCAESADPVGTFADAWDLWLVIDYKPIFATARNALRGLAQDRAFTAAVQGVARAALRVVRDVVGLRHDLLGRIFHRVLETARYDGSFYTTTAAATLLANLAIRENTCVWSDRNAIARLRITDPACGTGTLLMAAAERIRDLSRDSGNGDISQPLIEQVLSGYDVNLTATHLAATTLGLLSPTTTFQHMKIGRALLGVEDGKAYLGSLEFLSPEPKRQPRLIPWPTGIEQIEDEEEITEAEPADLVIMNPPFTRDSLRHDQFSREEELLLKEREKEIFQHLEGGIHRSHNGGGFLALADHIAKERNSTIAIVLPLVGATNYATREMRVYLAKKFHIETIVTSHDPARIYFSENTSIGEMLVVCRRWDAGDEKPATRVVNLHENPPAPAAALVLAYNIIEENYDRIKGTVQLWPRERIAAGDWGAVQFLAPYLSSQFIELHEGRLLTAKALGEFAELGPAGQGVRGIFDRWPVPDEKAIRALWFHKTNITQKMLAQTDTYIRPKPGKVTQAADLWAKRGTLMITTRARLNTVRSLAVRLNERAIGSLWVPCKFNLDIESCEKKTLPEQLLEKALCAYLNSTIGVLAMLGDRTNKIPSYPHFSMDDLNRLSVPDFTSLGEAKIKALASAYDQFCNSELLPLPQIMADETRGAIDRIVTEALGIAPETVANIRRELSREPSVTGKPYETN